MTECIKYTLDLGVSAFIFGIGIIIGILVNMFTGRKK